jgi:membrane-bound lytic murein transglycosylase A
VGYAASNGHDYRSVAEALIDDGRIPRDEISLARMIAFFDAHPDMVDDYVNRNPRFIFFGKTEGAPRGSINEPVTPMHTIATDKEVYPAGALAYYKADLPMKEGRQVVFEPVSGFALDQDTGGAIRAPGRCDVYIGIGENAGERAGRIKQEGRLYYIFLKLGELEAAGAVD